MKFYIIVAIIGALTWGTFPAQAEVIKNDFNLVTKVDIQKKSVVDMNDIIYLKARVKELEEENNMLKKLKNSENKEFGLAYITNDGKLRRKADDDGNDWDWDGKTWYRSYGITNQPTILIQPDCPNGKCPLKK